MSQQLIEAVDGRFGARRKVGKLVKAPFEHILDSTIFLSLPMTSYIERTYKEPILTKLGTLSCYSNLGIALL